MRSIWKSPSGMRCKDIGNNLFLFVFNNKEDYDWVLRQESWLFDKSLVLLQKLHEEVHPSKVEWKTCLLRVRVYGVPLVCMSYKVGQIIGQSMGVTEEVEWVKDRGNQGSYFHLRVLVPINEPLRRGMNLACGCLGKVWVYFKYEKLPNFCFVCGCLGHVERDCLMERSRRDKGDMAVCNYGQWLRVKDMSRPMNS
ncbi:DUF4283 domain-containing protein/zf-CCHC_4 domain-containing protein [Cephalotus follicularis]|uniref:DUF4283 domain-containing protein/zf-CCHC_4 domain-containing protein n=1 Tax=Cephalotus follicularis TaxID=3775 RepID=A0A1Q3B1S7_CEPFO|nr:DUF4283 domain-containing protein/zf-CCHC_4 domain-containing protein [Cephalotus follicularis]